MLSNTLNGSRLLMGRLRFLLLVMLERTAKSCRCLLVMLRDGHGKSLLCGSHCVYTATWPGSRAIPIERGAMAKWAPASSGNL